MKKAITVCAVLIFSLAMGGNKANASIIYDDFEDGDYDGWLTSWQQGQWGGASGSWDVVLQNGSNMARVTHKKSGFHSLAHDFAYTDDEILSFDMQIGGVTDGGNHAGGYVIFSFLSKFNVEIGSGFLGYSTNSALIPDAYEVDANPHNYSASMSEWADFAGITTTDQIATLSLVFKAWGQDDSWLQAGSTGTVWFDNVNVVPEPATMALLGLGGLLTLRRKRKV